MKDKKSQSFIENILMIFLDIIKSIFSKKFVIPFVILLFSYKLCQLQAYLKYCSRAEGLIISIVDMSKGCKISKNKDHDFRYYQKIAREKVHDFNDARSYAFGDLLFDKKFTDLDEVFFNSMLNHSIENCDIRLQSETNFETLQKQFQSVQSVMIKHILFL